ncbi:MAG: CoA transferase, partial [Pseudomonadales bacterium]|nr:CoA transferase [Pseudomonadales bacterium]
GGNGDSIFVRLMNAAGRSDIGEDPACSDNQGRVQHQARIDAAIAGWTATLSAAEVVATLEAADVPVGLIYDAQDMLNDPQYQARGMFEEVEVPGGTLTIPALLPKLARTPGTTRWGGPEVGVHRDSVLKDLGYSAAEIEALAANGDI